LGKAIADARAEMERLIQLGELQNDTIRHPIQALSVHLDALYKLSLASAQAFARQVQASDTSRRPAVDDEIRRAPAQAIPAHAGNWGGVLNARNALIVAGMLLTMLVGAGGGYWIRGGEPTLVSARAEAEKCEDRTNGSRLCWIPVWEKLPPAPAGK
jgi:hypothetical protein